jgi:EAL domain-containing protein (putative c-di-GMP-specific phosphodiesterase class I)
MRRWFAEKSSMDEKFLDQMDQEFTGWDEPAVRLRAALDNDELILYCQPIRALSGDEHYPMAEVLVRMRFEEKMMLPPGEFLPAFEHYRMMPHLDRWVVRNVIKHLVHGSRMPRFTINLSGQTLLDPDFPDDVAGQAKAAGIACSALLFEIDEADLLARPESVAVTGAALNRIGSKILLDGFGHKAVSFAPLKSLRVDFIKVDGSITRRVLSSGSAETRMKAILRVGEALGIGVVAECVENQDVLARLKAMGTGYAQGFGIAEPLPMDSMVS